MKKIIYISMKPSSSRCPNKNFREIGDGTPIYKLAFDKALALYNAGIVDEVRVTSSDDSIQKLIPAEFVFVKNLPENETGFEINTLNYVFSDLEPEDIVMKISIVNPFVPLKAIQECVTRSSETGKPVLVLTRLKKLYYDENLNQINFKNPFRGYTQVNPCIYEYTGTIALPKSTFETAFDSPEIVEVSQVESLDIDTEEEFWLAKAIFSAKGSEV